MWLNAASLIFFPRFFLCEGESAAGVPYTTCGDVFLRNTQKKLNFEVKVVCPILFMFDCVGCPVHLFSG